MLPARAGSIFRQISKFGAYSNQESPKSENVEKTLGFTTTFWRSRGVFSGGKRTGTGPKKKPLKRNSFGAAGKIMLPNEGGKHIFKNLVSHRMKIQQSLKTVWKNLENVRTVDEEMKESSAKAAKASRKQEKCENNAQFPIAFLNLALPRWRVKNGKTVPRCLL